MKRAAETVTLGLLLTLLCLALGGAGCRQAPKTQKTQCKYVVGSYKTEVSVLLCKMPDGKCYYIPGKQGGNMLKTRCYDHIFAEHEALR